MIVLLGFGAAFLILVLVIALGLRHESDRPLTNDRRWER